MTNTQEQDNPDDSMRFVRFNLAHLLTLMAWIAAYITVAKALFPLVMRGGPLLILLLPLTYELFSTWYYLDYYLRLRRRRGHDMFWLDWQQGKAADFLRRKQATSDDWAFLSSLLRSVWVGLVTLLVVGQDIGINDDLLGICIVLQSLLAFVCFTLSLFWMWRTLRGARSRPQLVNAFGYLIVWGMVGLFFLVALLAVRRHF